MASATVSNDELRRKIKIEMKGKRAAIKALENQIEEDKKKILYSFTEEEAAQPGDNGWWARHHIAIREAEEVEKRSIEEHVMRISSVCVGDSRMYGREKALLVARKVAADPQFRRLFKGALKRCQIVSSIHYQLERDDTESESESEDNSECEYKSDRVRVKYTEE